MSYLPKYNKKDFQKLSWNDYNRELKTLYKKINAYVVKKNIKLDAIVPIMRAGNIAATYLAYKFHMLSIRPVQYHYYFGKKGKIELRKIMSVNIIGLPKKPTFLLVEGDHCYGTTAEMAAKDLKKQFPGCKILYAADHMDYSYQKNKYADVIFYGRLTNECKELSATECKKRGVDPTIYMYPWEEFEEEWKTVNVTQFRYSDIGTLKKAKKQFSVSV